MNDLTQQQLNRRWTDIKRLLRNRPLLAYKAKIPLEEWNNYMHSTPSNEEIQRIYDVVQEDRKEKTLRIKAELSKMVGYRESKEFSRKCGVSDTSIKDIIEGKKVKAGYEIIDKLELFISRVNSDFETSLENPLDTDQYVKDEFEEVRSSVLRVSNNLKSYSIELGQMAKTKEVRKDWNGNSKLPSDDLHGYDKSINSNQGKNRFFLECFC